LIYNRGGHKDLLGKIEKDNLKLLCSYAQKGYVLLASQYRECDGGEGKDMYGGKDIDDVLNLIPLAKSLDFTIPEKIVMIGYSRGGLMTYLSIKNQAEIKAAAIISGVTDLELLLNERGI